MNEKRINELSLFVKQLDRFLGDMYLDEVYMYMLDFYKMAEYCGTQENKLIKILNKVLDR